MLDFMSSIITSVLFVQMLTFDCIFSFEHRNHLGETACVYFHVYSYLVAHYHTVSAYLGLPLLFNDLILNTKRQLVFVPDENLMKSSLRRHVKS